MNDMLLQLKAFILWAVISPLEFAPWVLAILMIYYAQYSRAALWFAVAFTLKCLETLIWRLAHGPISNAIYPYNDCVILLPLLLVVESAFLAGCWQLAREIILAQARIEAWNAGFGGDRPVQLAAPSNHVEPSQRMPHTR